MELIFHTQMKSVNECKFTCQFGKETLYENRKWVKCFERNWENRAKEVKFFAPCQMSPTVDENAIITVYNAHGCLKMVSFLEKIKRVESKRMENRFKVKQV